MFRTIVGFLFAPFPVALFQSIVVALWPPPAGAGVFEHPASTFIVICVQCWLFGLFIGTPTWLYLRRHSNFTLGCLVSAGLVVELTPTGGAMIIAGLRGEVSVYEVTYTFALFGIGGMVTGALFWLIAVRKTRTALLEETFS